MAYERQLAEKAEPGRRGAAPASAASTASSSSRSSRRSSQWRYRNKLEYSFGARRRRARARLPSPRQLGRGRRRRRLPARLRGQQRGPQRGPRVGARARASPPTTAAPQTGVLRNLVVREGRRTGQLQTRLVTSPAEIPRPPVDLHTVIEGPAGGTDGPTGVLGAEHLDRGALRAALPRLPHAPSCRPTPRWPSASTRSPPSSPGLSGSERLFDLFCGIGTIGLSLAARRRRGLGPRERRRGDRRRRGTTRRANGIANARFVARRRPARDPRRCSSEAGRPDVVVVDPPARGPLEEDRPPAARVRGAADRLRLLQPDDAGAERGPDRRGRLYAAPREAGRHVPADAARRVRRGASSAMS